MGKWLKAAIIRAIKTGAQAAVAIIGTSAVIGDVDWMLVIGSVSISMLLSVLTSIAGLPEVDDGASLFSIHDDEADIEIPYGQHVAGRITDDEAETMKAVTKL